MQLLRRLLVIALMVAALPLSACQGTSEEEAEGGDEPASVEPLDGTNVSRITLTAKAAERLGIQTAPLREAESRTVVPYAAVIYDPSGATWTYTSPEPLVFIREPITIDRIDGDQAFLLDGPPPGTAVVTVGAAELYGTELGIE